MTALILTMFLVTSAADSVTTVQAVHRGAREGNPLMASMPLPVALGVKTGFAVGAVIYVGKTDHKTPFLWAMAALSVMQLTVAAHNHQVGR